MNVDGFREAFEHTVVVRLFNGAELPFCSLPGLAMLKIFAWQARGHGNGKDAIDLFTIISEYGNIEEERIWDAPLEEEDLGTDLERMGAFLLGLDIAALLQQSSHGITAAQLCRCKAIKLSMRLSPKIPGKPQIALNNWSRIFGTASRSGNNPHSIPWAASRHSWNSFTTRCGTGERRSTLEYSQ